MVKSKTMNHSKSPSPSSPSMVSNSLRANLVSLYQNAQQNNENSNHGSTLNLDNDSTTRTSSKSNATSPPPPSTSSSLPSHTSESMVAPPSLKLRNPHSILSLEPKKLSQQLKIPAKDICKLRQRIACTIVEDDTIGNRKYLYDIDGNANGNTIDDNTAATEKSKKRNRSWREDSNDNACKIDALIKRKIPSAINANELYHISSISSSASLYGHSKNGSATSKIKTGSYQLDQLFLPSSSSSSRKRQQQHHHQITTSKENDAGGIELGTITELCGVSSSGKTQFALSIAANAIFQQNTCTKNKFIVHYITCGGGSSSLISLARRFRQLCKTRIEINHASTSVHSNNHDYDILNRIKFIPVNDNVYHLLSVLNDIEKNMNTTNSYAYSDSNNNDGTTTDSNNNNNHHHVHCLGSNNHNNLIIIDSISGCLSSSLYSDGDGGIGVALMNEISLILRRLSRWKRVYSVNHNHHDQEDISVVEHDNYVLNGDNKRRMNCCECAILITNGMVSDYRNNNSNKIGFGYKPALGELWRVADIRLILHPIQHIYDNHHEEEDKHHGQRRNDHIKTGRQTSIAGLKLSKGMIVNAKLEKHYMKYCHPSSSDSICFSINHTGIVDID